jgi:hypothetical protein
MSPAHGADIEAAPPSPPVPPCLVSWTQPGTLAQLLLHETAVAWVRARQTITTPKKPWTETREAFGERLRAIARHINTQYRVDDLCREFPGRIQQLIDVEGDNLKK